MGHFLIGLGLGFLTGAVATWLYARWAIAKIKAGLDRAGGLLPG